MAEIRSSGQRGSVTLDRCARVRRGLGRVMAAAKALGAGEIEAARHEIAEIPSLDVFDSDVMEVLEQIDNSLRQGQTRRAAAELQTVAGAMREELLRCAEAASVAAPRAVVPASRDRAESVRRLDLEPAPPIDPGTARPMHRDTAPPIDLDTAPPIDLDTAPPLDLDIAPSIDHETPPSSANAPPRSFAPDAARALALAQLLGKADPPRTKRVARRIAAAYVIAACVLLAAGAGAVVLVRATEWRTFFNAAPPPAAIVTQPPIARTSGDAPTGPLVAQTRARETDVPIALPTRARETDVPIAPPPAARETDVAIAVPTRGASTPSEQRHDAVSRAIDLRDVAVATEPRVVTPQPQPAPNVERAAATPPLPEPPVNLRAPAVEMPAALPRIEPPSAPPADASVSPTPPSDAAQIQRALGEYRQAYDRLDARGARAVWPGVNEQALARAFADLESQGLVFDRCDVNVGDDSATAVCNGSARYVTKVGTREPQVEPRRWTFSLRKSANGWQIQNVETRAR
jgi:hypothetical protein